MDLRHQIHISSEYGLEFIMVEVEVEIVICISVSQQFFLVGMSQSELKVERKPVTIISRKDLQVFKTNGRGRIYVSEFELMSSPVIFGGNIQLFEKKRLPSFS